MADTGANAHPLPNMNPILHGRPGLQQPQKEPNQHVGVSPLEQSRKRKLPDENCSLGPKAKKLSKSQRKKQRRLAENEAIARCLSTGVMSIKHVGVPEASQGSSASPNYTTFSQQGIRGKKGERGNRNRNKGKKTICYCKVTPAIDISLYRLVNCNVCKQATRQVKREKKLTKKMNRIYNTEKKDFDDRGVVTLEEKEEKYLSSLLQEIKESKTNNETDVLLDTNAFKRIDNCPISRNISYNTKLRNDITLDYQLYYDLLSKENGTHLPRQVSYQRMLNFRREIPAYKIKNDILSVIEKNQVSLISGETGCGKTTQVAQFILDDYIKRKCGSTCHIVCTQPRRISAISVAQRVASERAEQLGESCGYIIRLENVAPRRTGSILFCTTGVLLRFLIDDPHLKKVSHVIIDEIHERDSLSDFLLIIIKGILPYRPNLRVILMSATLNAEMFSKYFDNCPITNIPGRTHPVKEFYLEDFLEKTKFRNMRPKKVNAPPKKIKGKHKAKYQGEADYQSYIDSIQDGYCEKTIQDLRTLDFEFLSFDLIISVVDYICEISEEGAILIFLPGWQNISKMLTKFNLDPKYSNRDNFRVIPVHSKLPSVSQKEVFDQPPRGCRKIVIGTNIVETSITINDIVFVINGGKVKEKRYNADNNISSLETVWVSKASSKQRAGRAGRVQPGECYHLFTKYHLEAFDEYQSPEILRVPLDELCLQIKVLKCGKVWDFLNKAMQPPTVAACKVAVDELLQMGALDEKEELTSLGYHLARLPVAPKVGRLILSGAMFSCLDPILTIAASLESKSPFCTPMGMEEYERDVRREFAGDSQSDHIVLLNVFNKWEKENSVNRSTLCRESYLSYNTLQTIIGLKKQFAYLLYEIGFINANDPKHSTSNRNSHNINLIKAVICAGFYPNLAKIKYKGKNVEIQDYGTKNSTTLHLHPKSVNKTVKVFESQWLIYYEKMRAGKLLLYDSTVISPYPLLFFGGSVRFHQELGIDTIEVDKGIKFHCSPKTAEIIIALRKELNQLFVMKINDPTMNLVAGDMKESHHELIMRAIIDLITSEKMLSKKSFVVTEGLSVKENDCNINEMENPELKDEVVEAFDEDEENNPNERGVIEVLDEDEVNDSDECEVVDVLDEDEVNNSDEFEVVDEVVDSDIESNESLSDVADELNEDEDAEVAVVDENLGEDRIINERTSVDFMTPHQRKETETFNYKEDKNINNSANSSVSYEYGSSMNSNTRNSSYDEMEQSGFNIEDY